MKPLHLASFLVAATALLAGAPASADEIPSKPALARPVLKAVTSLTTKNVSGVAGLERPFEATLTTKAGAPLAGKTLAFHIEGKNGTTVPSGSVAVGSAKTDDKGLARVTFALPELAQGAYTVKAVFTGDEGATSSSATADLAYFKVNTTIELGDLLWGSYKDEPGPAYGVIGIKLQRASDSRAAKRPLEITVNGKSWTIPGDVYHQVPLPTDATTWKVSVQFAGDATYNATSAQRTYTKPK